MSNRFDISDLGEFELITRLTQNLPLRPDVSLGIGDDCAILDTGDDLLLLVTCDSQVEGIHFTFQTSTPEQIGHKALAVNLSDIAAMGGEPRYALVSLKHLSLAVLDGIYTGLARKQRNLRQPSSVATSRVLARANSCSTSVMV